MRLRVQRSLLFSASLVVLYVGAIWTPLGQQVDAASLGSFGFLREGSWVRLYDFRDAGVLMLLALAVGVAVGGAVLRDHVSSLRGIALIVSVGVFGLALDVVLARPDLGAHAYPYNTFPSGHAALGLAAVVAVAWMQRPRVSLFFVAALGLVAWIVSVISVLSFAHRASDVVGGLLMVGAVAPWCAATPREFSPSRMSPGEKVLAGVAGGAQIVGVVLAVVAAGSDDDMARVELIGWAFVLASAGLVTWIVAQARRDSSPRLAEAASLEAPT